MPAAQPFKKVGSEKQSKLSKAALELRNCTKPGHNYNFYLLEIGLMSLNVYTLKVTLCIVVFTCMLVGALLTCLVPLGP